MAETSHLSKVLFEDDEGNRLWCVRDYDPRPLTDFDFLELDTEPTVTVYGRVCHQRRCVGFYSDDSAGYKYSHTVAEARKLPLDLRFIMDKLNDEYGYDYNGILVNRYRNGLDHVGAHGDSEEGLCRGSVVSISYGASRKFRIYEEGKMVCEVLHEHGMLLCMEGENFQRRYKHTIPIEKKVKEARLSLTFRRHKQ